MSFLRVLLVEDFCAFRRAIRTMLEELPRFQVVGEAADGDAAIQLAAALLPDLILLDINLPKLNGLQVVPHILRLSPSSKIVFLTQEPSTEVAEEALHLGARGYVVKSDAGGELLRALEAVMRDERYVSRRLRTHMASETLHRFGIRNASAAEEARTGAQGSPGKPFPCAHEAHYYLHDHDFQKSLQICVSKALRAGDAVIVLLTLSHQQALCRGLQATGLAISEEIKTGRLQLVDANALISGYFGDEIPVESQSREQARLLVESGERARIGEHSRVCVFGECLSLLFAKGKRDAVLRLERTWDELGKTHDLYLRCWYQVSQERLKSDHKFFQELSEQHTAVYSL
jgi:DNA-binding NarL/FixJ family response regulator